MSRTRTVPAAVPSLRHSSRPLITAVAAEQDRVTQRGQPEGSSALAEGVHQEVPAAVPSVLQSPMPSFGVLATKNVTAGRDELLRRSTTRSACRVDVAHQRHLQLHRGATHRADSATSVRAIAAGP